MNGFVIKNGIGNGIFCDSPNLVISHTPENPAEQYAKKCDILFVAE